MFSNSWKFLWGTKPNPRWPSFRKCHGNAMICWWRMMTQFFYRWWPVDLDGLPSYKMVIFSMANCECHNQMVIFQAKSHFEEWTGLARGHCCLRRQKRWLAIRAPGFWSVLGFWLSFSHGQLVRTKKCAYDEWEIARIWPKWHPTWLVEHQHIPYPPKISWVPATILGCCASFPHCFREEHEFLALFHGHSLVI